ncbi:MAG TPA: hypothetical protein VGQ92_21425 [Actinoplanes sp.]|nr:hypothetical protein [Actinoplanes sp.]
MVSGHEFLSTLMPCAVILYLHRPATHPAEDISYLGAADTTISGSRSGHTPLLLHWSLTDGAGFDGHRRRAKTARDLAAYSHDRLRIGSATPWLCWPSCTGPGRSSSLARLQTEAARGAMTDADYFVGAHEGPAKMRVAVDKILDDNHPRRPHPPNQRRQRHGRMSGYPDTLVQGGVDANGISAGIGFVAKAFTEPHLLGYAYAYEQGAHARIVPALTPPIP